MKRPPDEYSPFVEHPRFGRRPRFTGLNPVDSSDGSVHSHWHSGPGVRVPNTAIAAHVSSQVRATVPVTHYFDARRVCRRCQRPFLFFAEEQKYWYEELKFPLEADCLDCVSCRKDEQQLRRARQKYDALLASSTRTETETLELIECALLLVESSVFSKKVLATLRRFLKPVLAAPARASQSRGESLLSRIGEIESGGPSRRG